MSENQKNYSSLSKQEKEEFKSSLAETEEILSLQAKIATHRATIQTQGLQELMAFLKLDEFRNPKKPKDE